MTGLIITWLVTAASLMIISRLDVGIYVADFGRALVAALVIGLMNAFIAPWAEQVAMSLTFANSEIVRIIILLIVNGLLFWLAVYIVKGFSLKHKLWSAILGSVLLTLIHALLFWLLGIVGIT